MNTTPDALAVMRSRAYVVVLVIAGVLGAVVSAVSYWYLDLIDNVTRWFYSPGDIPRWLGFHGTPPWWPLPVLVIAGTLVGLTVRYLPGQGGEAPVFGFHAGAPPRAGALPGIALAALAGIALGAVVGPEMPLVALGAGLAALAVHLVRREAPPLVVAVLSAAGGFAAISALLGSPILAAFLLMEASGLAGATMTAVLVPGLLAAGIGSLVFIGIGSWTGLGTFSLALLALPALGRPDLAEFGWALAVGVAAAVVGSAARRMGLWLLPRVRPRPVWATAVAGLVVAALAVAYQEVTGHASSDVLFSGQSGLPALIADRSSYSVGALLLLLALKGVAYGTSLSSFRGGPTFPAMFLGAAGGIAMSHLPGLPVTASVAMGIGAMTAVMLRLPMTSTLLAALLLGANVLDVMPLVIVAVVVAYVVSVPLTPAPAAAAEALPPTPAPSAASAPARSDGVSAAGQAGDPGPA